MCGDGEVHLPGPAPVSRRAFVVGAAAFLALPWGRAFGQDEMGVRPRSDWAEAHRPTGPLEEEEEVVFLLVHHTATTNDYAPGAVPDQLRAIYRFHTAQRGWPDVAYNFFVDRFGGIWEGREGSLERPMKADATGGSQGHAVLCSFLGDHRALAPTVRAQDAMVWLLTQLSDRYRIDPRPGTTVEFVSRGSSLWPAGARVTTATIAGHRDMSRTACPGDAAYRLVQDHFPGRVAAAWSGPPASPVPTPEATDSPESEPEPTEAALTGPSPEPSDGSEVEVVAGAGVVALGAAAGATFLMKRGRQR